MSAEERIGWLVLLTNGYWAIDYHDERKDEIHSGDMIYLQTQGVFCTEPGKAKGNALVLTRIEFDHSKRRFYSVEGLKLEVGARACLGGMRF